MCVKGLSGATGADAVFLALFNPEQPRGDEIVLMHGWPAPGVQALVRRPLREQGLFRAAMENGSAVGSPSAGLGKFGEMLVHCSAATADESTRWCLALARRAGSFSETTRRLTSLVLRHWQMDFDGLDRPVSGRLWLGGDRRLIHADLWSQSLMVAHPSLVDELLEVMVPVLAQRWENEALDQTRDMAASLAGQAMWVRVRHWSAAPSAVATGSVATDGGEPAPRPWYVELHPLEADELPIVGAVADPRIAHALGFIHDRFADSPSLNDIAKAVHISPFHFHRLFSRQVGISPKHYLQAKQFQVARWMLRATREPIGRIAAAAGFSSHGHFTSAFHRTVGVSPSTYREQRA